MFLLTAALFGLAFLLAVAGMAFTLRSALPRIRDVLAGRPQRPALRLVEVRRIDFMPATRRTATAMSASLTPRQAALRAA